MFLGRFFPADSKYNYIETENADTRHVELCGAYIMMQDDLWAIISGGAAPIKGELELLKKAAHVVCADGGANHAFAAKIVPRTIIGDKDSVFTTVSEHFVRSGVVFVTYPTRKNQTDTQLAIEYALSEGANHILLTGISGGRPDHFFANISLIGLYGNKAFIRAACGDSMIYCCREGAPLYIEGARGDLLSVIPFGGGVRGVSLTGLEYPLDKHDIIPGDTIGISNVFFKEKVKIELDQGILLVTHIPA